MRCGSRKLITETGIRANRGMGHVVGQVRQRQMCMPRKETRALKNIKGGCEIRCAVKERGQTYVEKKGDR